MTATTEGPTYVPPTRKTPLTGVSVPIPVRDAANRSALQYSAQLGRRISIGALIAAAIAVASEHPAELAAALDRPSDGEGD